MIGLLSSQLSHYIADQGFSFEGHFRNGAECILARPEAPKAHFPDSMPLEFVRDTIEAWNVELKGFYPGTGYYAFDQEYEMANPSSGHVLVLFADDSFCNSFLGSVASETLPPKIGGSMKQYFGARG